MENSNFFFLDKFHVILSWFSSTSFSTPRRECKCRKTELSSLADLTFNVCIVMQSSNTEFLLPHFWPETHKNLEAECLT